MSAIGDSESIAQIVLYSSVPRSAAAIEDKIRFVSKTSKDLYLIGNRFTEHSDWTGDIVDELQK